MAILLTGGGGKTSLRLARLLTSANVPVILASRRGQSAAPPGVSAVTFDWSNPSTYSVPFTYKFPGGEHITAVYLVASGSIEPIEEMGPFIDVAVKQYGVRRFVLLGGSVTTAGGPFVGKVYEKLVNDGLEYAVLKPTWFMENFSQSFHLPSIQQTSKFYTAAGNGKIPFVSAGDIAAIAFHALVAKEAPNTEYRITGSELLTHDEVAVILSKATGRKIEYVKLDHDERVKRLAEGGHVPEGRARLLTRLEVAAADGKEEDISDAVLKVTGKAPVTFQEFADENKAVWT